MIMRNLWVGGITCSLLAASAASNAQSPGVVTGNEFNPAISLILDGRAAVYSNNPQDYEISGFLLGEEAGLPNEGLSLGETELDISANIDDKFYGFFTVALESEGEETEIEIEEAFFETTSLPYGLKLKGGRFLSAIGYLNDRHAHLWNFVDAPLVYRAMFANQLNDDGLQVTWIAPTDFYLRLGSEVGRGGDFPGAGAPNSGFGTYTLFADAGGDISSTQSWIAGLSFVFAEAEGRESAIEDGVSSFTGDSDTVILDFVWKWAKNGNPRLRHAIVQAEYMHREEEGRLDFANASVTETGLYEGKPSGFYVEGVYQFIPRWRVGLRFDHLRTDNVLTGLTTTGSLLEDRNPERISAMVDFSHSEYSRFRFQINRDDSTLDSDTQFYLQYLMSLGAHGAHQF